MNRESYNKCLAPYLKGKNKTKEQRQFDMCVGAKLCSGKAQTEEEAKALCSLPKEPKVSVNENKTGKICKLRTDTEELCVPCEVANAVAAFAAIGEAHPGQIDTSIIDAELTKGTDSPESWLNVMEQMKKGAKGEAAAEAKMVTNHLYQLICHNE